MDLSNRAERIFLGTQAFGQHLGLHQTEWARASFIPLDVHQEKDDGSLDLSTARISTPVARVKCYGDLVNLSGRVISQLSNPVLNLGELFLVDAQIIAANVGAMHKLAALPLVVSPEELLTYQDIYKVKFRPGACILSDYSLDAVTSLRSSGLGNFVLVEESSKAERLYFSSLIRPRKP